MLARTTVSMTTGTDLVVEGTVDPAQKGKRNIMRHGMMKATGQIPTAKLADGKWQQHVLVLFSAENAR